MAEYVTPGVFIEEVGNAPPAISGVPTATALIAGELGSGNGSVAPVTSFREFERTFSPTTGVMTDALRGFFDNGGERAFILPLAAGAGQTRAAPAAVRAALETLEEVAIIAIPGAIDPAVQSALITLCEETGRFAVLDGAPVDPRGLDPRQSRASANAAFYAPWIAIADPDGSQRFVPPSGHVLGIYARTDRERGVWKTPANEDVKGAVGIAFRLTDGQQSPLNQRGVNLIRDRPGRGIVVWGARTLAVEPERRYVPVARLLLYIRRSLKRGMEWTLFEPQGERLWSGVTRAIEVFMLGLWRAGALLGAKPQEAFYVRCDRTVMTQADLADGVLVYEVGVATLRPAEFTILRFRHASPD